MEESVTEGSDVCGLSRWELHKNLLKNLHFQEFESQASRDHQAVLLDVRTIDEFRAGSLKGAINMDYLSTTLADEIDALDPGRHYYVFCRTGRRSLRVCMLLQNSGFRVYNLDGGINAQNTA